MKRALVLSTLLILLCSASLAQKARSVRKSTEQSVNGSLAVVIDERLSVLRSDPSLYAVPIKRLKIGTSITVLEEKEGEGVLFYKVAEDTAVVGWIQSEAIAGKFRKNDDHRVYRLMQGSTGFVQVQRGALFLEMFEDSPFRPTVLLLFGDILEEHAEELTKRADEALVRNEMAAARAPIHSFYLNYSELDEYRALGIRFLFNANTKMLHYNGDSWFEVTRRYPESPLSIEARERITSLTKKMKALQ